MRPLTPAGAAAAILLCLGAPATARAGSSEETRLTASDAASLDFFGTSVAIWGDTAVVGAYQDDDGGFGAGSAYVFVRSGTTWTEQQKLTAGDAAAFDFFGISVAISGDTALVGAYQDDDAGNASGSAYVFVRSGTVWTEQQKLVASDASAGDAFGLSVSVSGDTAVIGSRFDDGAGFDSGSAYVFVRSGTTWTEQQELVASDAAAGKHFGFSVSISGDALLVGAPGDGDAGDAGSAYVFVRAGSDWTERAALAASDGTAGDQLGSSVAIFGDTAVVGAPGAPFPSSSGSAYVFVRSGTTWIEEQELTAADAESFDLFGTSVSISGDTVVVGAYNDDEACPLDPSCDSGSAYVFVRTTAGWTEQAKLTADDAAFGDQLGFSVSISGATALVGAPNADLSAGTDAGAAYVFGGFPSSRTFCDSSDGALAACPCSNPGLPDTGCDNAQATGGVRIQLADYEPYLGTAEIVGTGLPGASSPTVIAIRGTELERSPVVFGDGIRCIAAPLVRFAATTATGGLSSHPVSHGAGAGTFHYQLWYRSHPASFCDPAAAFNTSNALSITWL